MTRTVSQWIARFGNCGIEAVRREIVHRFDPETDVKSIADWVRFMLGPLEDLSSNDRPFLWQSRDEANSGADLVFETDMDGQQVESKQVSCRLRELPFESNAYMHTGPLLRVHGGTHSRLSPPVY